MRWTRNGLLAIFLVVAACAPVQPQAQSGPAAGAEAAPRAPQPYKKLVAGIRGLPPALSQKLNFGGSFNGTAHLEHLVHAGLVHPDASGTLHPQLAEAVPTLENGLWKLLPDGRMETTWKLKPGIAWHDGTPLTSADLAFTARAEQTPGIAWSPNNAYEAVDLVETPDPSTITVYWKQPYVEAAELFSPVGGRALPLPRHLLERAFEEDRANFLQLPYWSAEFVGAGPYRVKEMERDSYVILVANDGYVLGRPKIDEIEVRFIADANTVIANLLAGEITYTMDGRTLTFEDSLSVRQQWGAGKFELGTGGVITMQPQFSNTRPAVVADGRFRKALMHAIDRQEMVDSIQGGLAGVADAYIGPDQAEYRDVESSIVRYEYDPRRAQQIIEGLGFTRAADGFFRDAASERLTVQLNMGPAIINQKAGIPMADYWQRVGIAVEPVVMSQQRLADRQYFQDFPAFLILRSGREISSFITRHSSRAPFAENNWSGLNRGHYMNPEFDALADRYFVTIPQRERMDVLGQIIRWETDQLIIMRIFFDPEATAIGNRLQNVPAGAPWNVHEWDLR